MSNDKDHRDVASHILKTAHKVVTTERGGQHGGAEDSFQMIADLWATYLNNTNGQFYKATAALYDRLIKVTPKDVAQMMVLLKIARNVHGALKEDDFIDQAGYTSLAAALAGTQAPPPPADKQPTAEREQTAAEMAAKLAPRTTPESKQVVNEGGDQMSRVLQALDKEITA